MWEERIDGTDTRRQDRVSQDTLFCDVVVVVLLFPVQLLSRPVPSPFPTKTVVMG